MTTDKNDLTRRDFLRKAAASSALLTGCYGISLTTDAVLNAQPPAPARIIGVGDDHDPYTYSSF